jgi:3'-5' exoribonuclease
MSQKLFVKDIRPNDIVRDVFLVKKKAMPLSKSGKYYLNLVLMDKTGEIEGRIWENAKQFNSIFSSQDFVYVDATALIYQDHLQLRIDNLRRVSDNEVQIEDFLPVTDKDIEQMFDELKGILNTIDNHHLRRFTELIMGEGQLIRRFKRSPAAKGIHHNYLGGLMEHTLTVLKLADSVCRVYPSVDRSLLLVGCLLHDFGKVFELEYERSIDYTDQGRLVGHIQMGTELVERLCNQIEGFPQQLKMNLKHLVLSHHGQYEYGSPVLPMTLEALLLYFLDDLDSKVSSWMKALEEEGEGRWTNYQKFFERFLYRGNLK